MEKCRKIALYIDVMYKGGAQRVMNVLSQYFLKNNYEVILITDFFNTDKEKEYEIDNKVTRRYLRKDNTGNKILKNIEKCRKLRKILKEEKPYLVLSFLGNPNKRLLLSSIGLKCKKVVSIRNDPNMEYGKNTIKKIVTNLLFLLADNCIFQTKEASLYFWKCIRKKSKIIFNPVDEKFFNIEKNKKLKNVITIGRLEKQKNHKLLIDAFSLIADKFPNDNLLIYGEGKMKRELEKYIVCKKLSNRVFLMGNIDKVEKALASAKIFVLSSNYEGMPNALMEAMASGTACISTDCPCGGPRTLIKNKEQGILVKCGDAKELANAIESMLKEDIYKKYERNANIRAEEFRTDIILKKWSEFLIHK